MNPLMWTDSETLMVEGVNVAQRTFERFLEATGWTRDSIALFVTHQVGKAHQQLLFEKLGLSEEKHYSTLEFLGNTGSVAMPTAATLAMEEWSTQGRLQPGDRIALLGIGSGINSLMLAITS